ncbi:unnamed protein product [Ilex paraguariensis]|uniref:Uncharacterized protein n=1 Tax=Ilex paraguariensis TaxID=185542 RepID=A0ABC8TH49_9AQUA
MVLQSTTFVDVSPEETFQKSHFESFKESTATAMTKDSQFADQVSQNGAASTPGIGTSEGSSSNSAIRVDCGSINGGFEHTMFIGVTFGT